MRLLFERLRSRTAAFLHDLIMVPLAWMLAYWLRFNLGEVPEQLLQQALWALPVLIPVQVGMFWLFGLYRGVWRYASLPDLIRILKAVLLGTLLTFVVLFAVNRLSGVPRSVPVLFVLIELTLLAGPRLLYRWRKDHRLYFGAGQRVLIVGAGRAGEMLVRDMLRDPERAYLPVAFVDDKTRRQGSEVQGIPIRGATARIPELIKTLDIELVMLAIPSANSQQMQRLVHLCEQAGVAFRTVPQLENLMSGQVRIDQLRKVSIEDLLGREQVTLDWAGMRAALAGRRVLVTGAGGSIGSELCRQLVGLEPASLVLFENSEFNLYRIEMELRRARPGIALQARLGDVVDASAVNAVFAAVRPEVVFHAAAYKHVPMLEDQIREAVRNNVLGTRVVADAADSHGCARFVLISTDKAVNPANVMGATKRIAEIYCQNLDRHSATRFVTVRFGNVLDSAGSVVPLFREQIERGGPVTVTHPDIKRYFMTIPEACQLIMQASVLGGGGEIFVLDMGGQVRIRYLAEQMIRLAGKIPGEDIPIVYIGLRPGEKLYEELFHEREDMGPTAHERIRVARYRAVEWDGMRVFLQRIAAAVEACDAPSLYREVQRMIPEWAGDRAPAREEAALR